METGKIGIQAPIPRHTLKQIKIEQNLLSVGRSRRANIGWLIKKMIVSPRIHFGVTVIFRFDYILIKSYNIPRYFTKIEIFAIIKLKLPSKRYAYVGICGSKLFDARDMQVSEDGARYSLALDSNTKYDCSQNRKELKIQSFKN